MANICIITSEKKARMSKSKIKSMLICFFDSPGIVHTEFVPQGKIVNHFYCCEILERLRKIVVRVRPSIANNWMLHHDNVPCHMAISVIGGVVVKALRYKPAGRGFDSRWCHWNFSVTQSFRSHYGPGVDSASNTNEYQVYFLGVKAAGA